MFETSCSGLILVFLFIKRTKQLITYVFIASIMCDIHEKLEFTIVYKEFSILE